VKKKKKLFRRRNIKKQERRRRTRNLLRALLVLTLVVGVGLGARALLTRLDLFSLKKIVVLGQPQTLSTSQVIQRSGVQLGTNLFSVDLQQVNRRLKGHEYFKTVSVHRRLPSTLAITIKEYFPEFLLHTGRFYYVDSEGEIFKDITDTPDKRDFVIFTGVTEETLLRAPQKIKKAVRIGIQLKEAYQKTTFFKAFGLSEVHYEENLGFTLYPEKQKYSIKMGNKDFKEKLEKLSQVLEKLENSTVKFSSIDLNYPGKVLMTL